MLPPHLQRPSRPVLGRSLALGLALLVSACGDSAPASATNSPPAVSRSLRGSIDIDPIVGVGETPFACIYLMGWRDARQGPPQLVRKLPAKPLPMSFSLDARHLASAGTIAGNWVLVARLDADGDAAAGVGDLQGTARRFVTADDPAVKIFLSDTLTADDVRPSTMGAGLDGVAGHGAAPVHPPISAEQLAAAKAAALAPKLGPRIRGTLTLAEEHAALNGTRTLFVIIKDKAAPRGMPRAVLQVDKPQFPLKFDVGVEHVPLDVENKQDLLAGQLYLTARLDADGGFMGAPGDIELAAPLPVTATEDANQKPVSAELNTRRND